MKKYVCITRYRDTSGLTIKYDLVNDTHKITVTADELRNILQSNETVITNLRLSANNSIILVKNKYISKPKDVWPVKN